MGGWFWTEATLGTGAYRSVMGSVEAPSMGRGQRLDWKQLLQ